MTHAIAQRSEVARKRLMRSFTLVEVLIVLGIILALVTLVVSVSSALVKKAERGQTEAMMTVVENALAEWESQAGRPMSFGTMNQPAGHVYDIMEMPPAAGRYIAVFMTNLLAQDQNCRQILATIPTDLLRRDTTNNPAPQNIAAGQPYPPSQNPRSELVDTWGNRIAMVMAGRRWKVGDAGLPDADGTIRTADENALGVCENARPCMISSGPDGLLGTEGGLTAQQRIEAISDNIYSYELLPIN